MGRKATHNYFFTMSYATCSFDTYPRSTEELIVMKIIEETLLHSKEVRDLEWMYNSVCPHKILKGVWYIEFNDGFELHCSLTFSKSEIGELPTGKHLAILNHCRSQLEKTVRQKINAKPEVCYLDDIKIITTFYF